MTDGLAAEVQRLLAEARDEARAEGYAAGLAAQLGDVEVSEEWGVRLTWPDGGHTDSLWKGTRAEAEATAEHHKPLPPLRVGGLVRRFVLTLPAEVVEER